MKKWNKKKRSWRSFYKVTKATKSPNRHREHKKRKETKKKHSPYTRTELNRTKSIKESYLVVIPRWIYQQCCTTHTPSLTIRTLINRIIINVFDWSWMFILVIHNVINVLQMGVQLKNPARCTRLTHEITAKMLCVIDSPNIPMKSFINRFLTVNFCHNNDFYEISRGVYFVVVVGSFALSTKIERNRTWKYWRYSLSRISKKRTWHTKSLQSTNKL